MNPNTNELITLQGLTDAEIKKKLEKGFIQLPESLQGEAAKELNGKQSVIVTKNEKLLNWSASVKSKRKKSRRRRKQENR